MVECLYSVPLADFDQEETSTILRLLSSCKNIGAGRTELVLAKLLFLLTRLAQEQKSFRAKFGERAVSEVAEVLVRNQARVVHEGEEREEKLALSLACLQFLKVASRHPDMRRALLGRDEQLRRLLCLEEGVAVEVEETWMGRDVGTLVHAVTGGSETLAPYSLVCFRLLQRIADVLMNFNVEELADMVDPFRPGVDVIETLKEHYRQKFKARKQREREHWGPASISPAA